MHMSIAGHRYQERRKERYSKQLGGGNSVLAVRIADILDPVAGSDNRIPAGKPLIISKQSRLAEALVCRRFVG